MALTADQLDLLPRPADVRHYVDHGWWVSPVLYSNEEIDRALEGAHRFYRGQRDHQLNLPIKQFLNWSNDSPHELRMNDFIVQQCDAIAALVFKPILGAMLARLAATDQIRLFNSSLIYKPQRVSSEGVEVGWHVDRAYWQTCTSENMLTAWIALDDVDATMGPLTVLDRSKHWPRNERVDRLRSEKNFICEDTASLERRLERLDVDLRPVKLTLNRGQVSVHHCLTFHGSGANHGDRPRIGVIAHVQDKPNRFRRALDSTGRPYAHNLDALVRRDQHGDPDYTDPRFCPVIWREDLDVAGRALSSR